MYKPIFHYTDRIVNHLTFIAEAKPIIINAPLIPNWEVSLRKAAFLNSAHSSTAIEGNPLTFEDVTALAEGHEIMVKRQDRQEVLNYFESLDKIPYFASKVPFTVEDLLKVHKIITKNLLEDNEDEGIFRNRQVVVGNPVTREVIFRPPETVEVPELIKTFLEWLNSPETENLNPIIVSGLTHYELVRIHPFIDGNGRTARIMAMAVLYKRGYDLKRFYALDNYYNMDRSSYYAALKTVNPDSLDQTLWLEYFTKGVAVSIKSVKDKVLGLSKDVKFLEKKGQIPLNDRQMKIVEKIIENGKIANKDVREMFNLSHSTAFDELQKLLELEVVEIKGKGRSTHYVLIT
jgi:Fic family protein